MPIYEYTCPDKCGISDLDDKYRQLKLSYSDGDKTIEEELIRLHTLPVSVFDGVMSWDETHSIQISPDVRCPACGVSSKRCLARHVTCYIRGYGYLDKSGATRDRNLYKMNEEDPYASMRQPGEAEDVKDRLRNAGKHGYNNNGERDRQYYT